MKASAKKTVRVSARATRRFVEQLGGKPTPASGAWLEKGDARVPGHFRIETKCPPTKAYRLTYEDFKQILDAAQRSNEIAVFHIKLGATEIVAMRVVDYLGIGGQGVAGSSRTHHFSGGSGVQLQQRAWDQMMASYDGAQVLLSRPGILKHFLLRLMPAAEFQQLAAMETT